jgi:MYXO-CTERM domain-containing protein
VPLEFIVQGTPADELADGTPVYHGVEVSRGFSCGWSGTLSKPQYLQALRSSNCPETVCSFEEWVPAECRSGCGCRAASAASPSSAGILMALLGVVAARRMARPNARQP